MFFKKWSHGQMTLVTNVVQQEQQLWNTDDISGYFYTGFWFIQLK